MVQGWWEGRQYYDYSTAYCDDGNDNNNNRKKRKEDNMEDFDECQSYTQVGKKGRGRGRCRGGARNVRNFYAWFNIVVATCLYYWLYEREWGGRILPGSRGSVVSALDFQTLVLVRFSVGISLSGSLSCCSLSVSLSISVSLYRWLIVTDCLG